MMLLLHDLIHFPPNDIIMTNNPMPDYRRIYIPNTPVFITSVTRNRHPFFNLPKNIDLFYDTLDQVMTLHPFDLIAQVLLPDHFHWIIKLPNETENLSMILQFFKGNFTKNYKMANHIDGSLHIWQKRFWDHLIRDEDDLEIHMDYIHWNPVKHHLTGNPAEYPYSSFQKYFDMGKYVYDWGINTIPDSIIGFESE